MKESKAFPLTWEDVSRLMNSMFRAKDKPLSNDTWRKKFAALADFKARQAEDDNAGEEEPDDEQVTEAASPTPPRPEEPQAEEEGKEEDAFESFVRNIEKQKVLVHDERTSYQRTLRSDARLDSLLEMFLTKIESLKPVEPKRVTFKNSEDKVLYALLSDIHWGISFDSAAGSYNTEIARKRMDAYAEEIIRLAQREGCDTVYISLLGDLISGIIHPAIRVENRENLVQQIMGVSEYISYFLYTLSSQFKTVYVNSVDGNHSRVNPNLEDMMRKERLDFLIPWYCRARLERQRNVVFIQNSIDATVASFEIFGKTFCAVHGDLDQDLSSSAVKLQRLTGKPIYALCAGHTHVAETRFEDVAFIRNGSVCGSGDEYTMKKRLFGPPVQLCMVVTPNGIESVRPVFLNGVK